MDPDEAAGKPQEKGVARRSVLRGLGAGALATGAGGILAACSSGIKGSQTASSTGTITLGYISPFTGPLAGFASGDRFVIDTIRATPAYSKGFKVGGRTYQVNIVVTDSQSDPNGASQLARQLEGLDGGAVMIESIAGLPGRLRWLGGQAARCACRARSS